MITSRTAIRRRVIATRPRVIRIRPGRITTRPPVSATNEVRTRISRPRTMIWRPVVTRLPITEARWRASDSAENLKLATTDALTGAWTRKFGLEEVSRELERAHRTGATLLLGFIVVDGLKAVNYAKGHLAGDELLRLLGEL